MKTIFIDVREPLEYATGHVEGALNIPPNDLLAGATVLNDLPANTPIVVYCRTGSRSRVAQVILESKGFTDITNGINKERVEAVYGE